jgi:hypothetical protein
VAREVAWTRRVTKEVCDLNARRVRRRDVGSGTATWPHTEQRIARKAQEPERPYAEAGKNQNGAKPDNSPRAREKSPYGEDAGPHEET